MDLQLSITYNILLFIFSAIVVWVLCNKLSEIVDAIDLQFNLGAAFGGTIMLAIVTNLPEIAIVFNGALNGNIDLAVGNILGGIAIQSTLLILFDFMSRERETLPFSTLASSETSILQGLFLVAILSMVLIGKQFPESFIVFRTTPPVFFILILWILSILAMKQFQNSNLSKNTTIEEKNVPSKYSKKSALTWLFIISVFVLFFGVILENTSNAIANHYNINGVIFGATVLAFVTSLPEISGGLAFVKSRSYTPIIDDIFGGNAFLPVLFVPTIFLTNNAILPKADRIDLYLTGVAMLITINYLIGMIIKKEQRYFGMGMDSWIALSIYLLSVIGLFFI